MFDHVGLRVKDLDRSVAFYSAALGALGYTLCSRDETSAGFGPPGEPALWLYGATDGTTSQVHVAFRSRDREPVDRFHERGLASGGRDHGPPGVRTEYSPRYYAAFLLDPDGNNVEAVCLEEAS